MSDSAQNHYDMAAQALQAGDPARSEALLREGLNQFPRSPDLWSALGHVAAVLGDPATAAEHHAKARGLDPAKLDHAFNQATALIRAGHYEAALAVLEPIERELSGSDHYCSTRGAAAQGAGRTVEAVQWYDRALAIEPGQSKALRARARLALETGADDALARFDRAIKSDPGDPHLWLGKAQALDMMGEAKGARSIMEQITQQAPGWIAGLEYLAQQRLGSGEKDFAGHFETAMAKLPQDPNIPDAWCRTLAGIDQAAEASDVAARARIAFPDLPHFALLEAIYAGASGDTARAETIYASLPHGIADREIHEARHRLRTGEFDRAEHLMEAALQDRPDDISAWALMGIVWRLNGDQRSEWLHEQAGLVQLLPLEADPDLLLRATAFLRELHRDMPMPLGQSLRGGTQTRGTLFHRSEPVLTELHSAIAATLESYRRGLPEADPKHPLLCRRDDPWRLAGSWSVRLTGGGDHHTAHIHPQGLVSSALYLVVPEGAGDQGQGCLEIGRPPTDLALDLPPLATITPKPGHMALFPSTLYHGTTPFDADERMTVAFDVVARL